MKPTIRFELKHGDMLTLGDVKCQYLVGLDMEEVGKELVKCVAGAKQWFKGLPDWKMKDIGWCTKGVYGQCWLITSINTRDWASINYTLWCLGWHSINPPSTSQLTVVEGGLIFTNSYELVDTRSTINQLTVDQVSTECWLSANWVFNGMSVEMSWITRWQMLLVQMIQDVFNCAVAFKSLLRNFIDGS